jgi:hypothetical protein
MTVDTKKLEQFLGQFVNDLGATVHAGMVVIGERLGLYKALAASPLTPTELAAITRTDERYGASGRLPRQRAVISRITRKPTNSE